MTDGELIERHVVIIKSQAVEATLLLRAALRTRVGTAWLTPSNHDRCGLLRSCEAGLDTLS